MQPLGAYFWLQLAIGVVFVHFISTHKLTSTHTPVPVAVEMNTTALIRTCNWIFYFFCLICVQVMLPVSAPEGALKMTGHDRPSGCLSQTNTQHGLSSNVLSVTDSFFCPSENLGFMHFVQIKMQEFWGAAEWCWVFCFFWPPPPMSAPERALKT